MMVTLNAGGSGETPSPSGNSFGATARSMVAKGTHPLHRRRRVGKGALSGFGGGYNKSTGGNVVVASRGAQSASSPDSLTKGDKSQMMSNTPQSNAPTALNPSSTSSGSPGTKQPQHSAETSAPPAKPCHSSRMSILCCQNAIRMGARAQLGLCPPGRPRRTLQAALRQRTRASSNTSHSPQSIITSRRMAIASTDTTGYYALERMIGTQSLEDYEDQEEDYLLSTNTFDVESDEEASSGDEDELSSIDALLAPEAPGLGDDESKYVNLREPLFTPIGVEGSLSNPNGAPMMSGMGSGASGKLPFNRRKMRYFDGITAQDRQAARAYLTAEADKARMRSALLLTRHLKRMQKEARKRRRQQKGGVVDNDSTSDNENEDPKEQALLAGGVAKFEQPMTAAMSAALILESLSLNPVESIEGMAKCYDGIVAAGVALLESQSQQNDPTSPHDMEDDKERPRTSRADVLAALAPLLITSLAQPSGDVIVLLARMRRMCGTPRYQRRFIQRVAPCLIRPKNAAMWCLRHQNDMEPIIAATELIFDSAHEIFSKGWYEKGQLYLADSKRAETLNSAAAQLRTLSGEPAGSEGLSLGFTSSHGHGMMRRYSMVGTSQKDQKKPNEQMAEWEVMAVDAEIRYSIAKIMSSDWSRVNLTSVKDSDSARSFRRNASSHKRPSVLPQSASGEASPRAMITSPRSPGRPHGSKTPLSPAPPKDYSSPTPTIPEQLFENIMPQQPHIPAERPTSPDSSFVQKGATSSMMSPSSYRQGNDDVESKNGSLLSSTPPRSPKSPMRDGVEQAPPLSKPSSAAPTPFTPLSPRRNKALSPPSSQNIKEANDPKEGTITPFALTLGTSSAAPLSPSSIGTSSTADFVSYRPSSGASVMSSGSGASQVAHYRTLTSTASERKRTVAACRALRAQITRFEEAFIQLHGRPPKGAAERAPLATTYSQYREWKRAIRADAACRIQALLRGARTRLILMRSDNPTLNRIVRKRAGRVDYVRVLPYHASKPPANQENILNQIGIPVEIGEGQPNRSASLKPSSGTTLRPATNIPLSGAVETISGPPANQSLAPQWATQVVRRRAGSGDRTPDGFPLAARAPQTQNLPLSAASSSSNAPADIALLSLPELQARKRELKQQLKQYDMTFAQKHGRMPVKAEKEPIRHLYENYNALKSQIGLLEQEGGRHMPVPAVQPIPITAVAAPPPQTRPMQIPPTPPESSDSDRSMDSQGLIGTSRGLRRNTGAPPIASSPPSGAPTQDLAALKLEKGQLHQMLRSYEKDFFREHNRQVSSFADIKPVASQYRRYKEIKKAIQALTSSNPSAP